MKKILSTIVKACTVFLYLFGIIFLVTGLVVSMGARPADAGQGNPTGSSLDLLRAPVTEIATR